jgi:MFS family permease
MKLESQPDFTAGSRHYKWLVVALLWFVCFLNYADRQAISSVLPLLKKDFGFQAVQLGFIASAFAWVYAGAAPMAGVAADRWKRKRLIVAACLCWSFFTLATAWCGGLWSLVVTRAFTGLGEAFYFPAAMALLSDYHSSQTRSRALTLHQSAVYAGTILGSWLAAELAERSGWQIPFYFFGPAGIILAAILISVLREPSRGVADNNSFDETGQLSLPQTLRIIGRLPVVWLLMGAFFCANFVAVIFLTWTPTFLVDKFHYRLGVAGLTGTVFIHLASVFGVLAAGALADWRSRRHAGGRMQVQLAGLLACAGCVFWVAKADNRGALIWAMMCFGVCKGFYDSGIFASLYDCIEPGARGTAAGLMNMVGWFGGALGPLFFGWMTHGNTASEAMNMTTALKEGALFYLIAAVFMLAAWWNHVRHRMCLKLNHRRTLTEN